MSEAKDTKKPDSAAPAKGGSDYFAKLGAGNRLVKTKARIPVPTSSSSDKKDAASAQPVAQPVPPPPSSQGQYKVVRKGRFDYMYDKNGRLVKRIPISRLVKQSSGYKAFSGQGHKLK